jgi:hypothetical protein
MANMNNIQHIKEIIKYSINNKEFKDNFRILLLKKKWIDIIGEKLSIHTCPEKIMNNKLYIKCDHQGWIQTLQFFKKNILENIAELYKKEFLIKDIIFLLGKITIEEIDNIKNTKKEEIKIEEKSNEKTESTDIDSLLNEYFIKCLGKNAGKTNT